MGWKSKENKDLFIFFLILAIGFSIATFYAFLTDFSAVGVNIKYLQPTVLSPYYYLLLALTFLIISYYLFKQKNKPLQKENIDFFEFSKRRKRRKKK
jgi:uncharacterized protein with PQ loop repeat